MSRPLSVALVVGAGGVAAITSSDGDTVVVDRVVDGDTPDVVRDGEPVRVRLLARCWVHRVPGLPRRPVHR